MPEELSTPSKTKLQYPAVNAYQNFERKPKHNKPNTNTEIEGKRKTPVMEILLSYFSILNNENNSKLHKFTQNLQTFCF